MDEEHKLVLIFAGEGSANFALESEGKIYANQLLAAAGYLEYLGKKKHNENDIRAMMLEQERLERDSIKVPGGVLKS